MLVLDASVLVKLFRDEEDSGIARCLVNTSAECGISTIAPSIVMLETLSVALHYEVAFDVFLEMVGAMRQVGFRLVEPTAADWKKAEMIATTTTGGSRPPSLQDSLYHALALSRRRTLVTADQKYFHKAQRLGSILMLRDWERAAPTPPPS
ncbi:type II toxin-antitoxin system VapC family toxin [Arvimicrobium flavum]|uniref:type II toxin-antitoxin system VapC family toxin n=1 Tax=Arvimicrobium flavum TaxID=3393320 RepID=UPI00237ABF09|nr:type II toxin-antitoxin system VapC family toxin [Mesorhizobium shangrilense]